jgi:hypothetical protein
MIVIEVWLRGARQKHTEGFRYFHIIDSSITTLTANQ